MGEKMTENEIITAWECCSNVITSSCKECPFHLTYNANCVIELMRVSLDLYNRQKAEIFNLNEEIANLKLKNAEFLISNEKAQAENERLLQKLQQAQSEAYREFAEVLKRYELHMFCRFPDTNIGTGCLIVLSEEIDNTLKELTESNE